MVPMVRRRAPPVVAAFWNLRGFVAVVAIAAQAVAAFVSARATRRPSAKTLRNVASSASTESRLLTARLIRSQYVIARAERDAWGGPLEMRPA